MNIKVLREKSKKRLSEFVNIIGLDGEYYASTCDCPMMWGTPNSNGLRRICYA